MTVLSKRSIKFNHFIQTEAKLYPFAGTGVTNMLINVRKAVDKSASYEVEDIPMLETSIAYSVY